MTWVSLGLSYLRLTQLFETVGLCLLPNLGSFQFYSLPPLFLRPLWYEFRYLIIFPQNPEAVFIFFLFSQCYSNWVNCIDLLSDSLILSPLCHQVHSEHPEVGYIELLRRSRSRKGRLRDRRVSDSRKFSEWSEKAEWGLRMPLWDGHIWRVKRTETMEQVLTSV